ncbi:class I SAM-dependent DNA methyltransferase [Roseobacter litoralis]|uniref:Methyltransferase-like protein n=1 Tax=Roseobacter litoralis (strain ATCC 49566 / DSM 6996 / JCM 21268 / NBRC 15278 / OCh 149) TaxID=391595 RepID=F7ZLY0_ROSLO|nr:class I SAM-dependent methyltransferase [Roseobacter litoralis]AEI95374.1 methyltransferase-like protein [Roseobacter litoralis Och 149]
MSDDETLSVYAAKAGDYANLTDDAAAQDPSLIAFIAAMPRRGRVLDLGCGPGGSAAVMAQAGLVVDAFDPVPEMVVLAGRHAGVSAREAGFEDVIQVDHYDGIWANFSLLHAPRDDMPKHLARIATALKPGGRFHIGVKTGTGSKRDTLGRRYTYYTESELVDLLAAAGLTVFDHREGCDTGLDGVDAHWIVLAAHA